MATIPIIGKVTVGGAAKELSGGYVNIGGVWKPVVKTYVNVGGVWKPAWKNLYTWKKYTVVQVEDPPYTKVKSSSTSTRTISMSQQYYCSTSYTFSTNTGKFVLTNPVLRIPSTSYKYTYLSSDVPDSSGKNLMREFTSVKSTGSSRSITYYSWDAEGTLQDGMGDYVADVTSENASAYPTNGKHTDGYWYVKQ